MIVPRHWAEARIQHKESGRQITVRRAGWSNESVEAAEALAESRAKDALSQLLAGNRVERREPKVPYNGAEGVPIREEIIAEHGDTIITRNSYGAWCLNTPNVLFADVDRREPGTAKGWLAGIILGLAVYVMGVLADFGSKWLMLLIALAVGRISQLIFSHFLRGFQGGWESAALGRIQGFFASHPEWRGRLYRTPAGFRVLALHRTFNPVDAEVTQFFSEIQTDRTYILMTQRQNCFRARLTAKPWRIGIPDHLRPRPGTWPVRPEALPMRQEWLAAYDARAKDFAACEFVAELGTGPVAPEAEVVRRIHDEFSRAESGLPIA